MAVVAALLMFVGVCMVLVTGVFALISVGNLRMSGLLRRTPPTPIGSWRPGAAPVATEAVTGHGPAGPQAGPLSGAECAWFRLVAHLHRAGGSDSDGDWEAELARSPAGPSLTDPSGRVLVDPSVLIDADGSPRSGHAPSALEITTVDYTHRKGDTPPPLTPSRMAAQVRAGDRVTLREFRLPYGREVFALARMTGDGLAPATRGRTVFTAARWADVIKAKEDDLRLMTVTIPVMFAGGLGLAAGVLVVLLAVTG